MRRFLAISLVLIAVMVAAFPASAEPGVSVDYREGLLRVTLDGTFAGSYYQVWRSGELVGNYDPMASTYSLCTGDCFLTDFAAVPGRTYFYRFDVLPPGGGLISYGPYAVTVPNTPLGIRVWPNPSNGRSTVEMSVPGSSRLDAPLQAEAKIVDLQGRVVRTLFSGRLVRGLTPVVWDGRGDAGQSLGAGLYFVRVFTPLGVSTARIVRAP